MRCFDVVEQSGLSPVRPYPTNSGCPLFGASHKLLKTISSLMQVPTLFFTKTKKPYTGFLFLVEQSGLSPVRPYPTNSGCPLFGASHKLLKTISSLMQVPTLFFTKTKKPYTGFLFLVEQSGLAPESYTG